MRTNIVLNDKLVIEAFKYAKVSTKRELIDLALREFVKNHKKGNIEIDSNYDYKSLGNEKVKD